MSSNSALAGTQSQTSAIVRYGQSCAGMVPVGAAEKQEISTLVNQMSEKTESNWVRVREQLSRIYTKISQPNATMCRYRERILSEVLIPYTKKMTSRWVLSPSRFHQLCRLMAILEDPEYESKHPVHGLLELDEICIEVHSEASVWQSDFGKLLQNSNQNLWRPVLKQLRGDAQSIATKFAVIGLIDVIGKPLLLVYPLWLILEQALALVQKTKLPEAISRNPNGNHQGISVSAILGQVDALVIMQLVKAFTLLFIVQKFMTLLQMFTGAGHVCLLLGIGLFGVTMNERVLKQCSPVLVSHLSILSDLMTQYQVAEKAFLSSLKNSRLMNSTSTAGGDSSESRPDLRPSNRVELLSEDSQATSNTPRLPIATAVDRSTDDSVPIVIPVAAADGVTSSLGAHTVVTAEPVDAVAEWTCDRCTFINTDLAATRCEICECLRDEGPAEGTSSGGVDSELRRRHRASSSSNN